MTMALTWRDLIQQGMSMSVEDMDKDVLVRINNEALFFRVKEQGVRDVSECYKNTEQFSQVPTKFKFVELHPNPYNSNLDSGAVVDDGTNKRDYKNNPY
jgi:aspartate carbamoyltransferase catalytic subunit